MNRKDTILLLLDDDRYPPMNTEEIMLTLDIPFDDREELCEILHTLSDSGDIIRTSKRKYASPRKLGYVTGEFRANERGFGFVIQNDSDDIFIPAGQTANAMDSDTVLVRPAAKPSPGRNAEGSVIKIIRRANDHVVGTYKKGRNIGFVIPDNKRITFDIAIPKSKAVKAADGQKVVAKIVKWPDNRKNPEGRITEILGFSGQKGVDMLSVMRRHNLHSEFDEKVIKQCANICDKISDADIACREDFRNMDVITIDGADSRDFDDAVCVTEKEGIYTLGVHIADVTHYVTENSPLDKEAFRRGTSVYFPDRVVPMLPERLSNGICSLNPGEDRLTLSIVMDINQSGDVVSHRITEGIIHSKERMVYDDVTALLEGDENLQSKYSHISDMLHRMKDLAEILRKKRFAAGGIDFDFPETKIRLDENGKAIDVYKYKPGIANIIIEEFMLLANKTVGEEFYWADIPFVYRIHEKPTDDKIAAFNSFAANMGYKLSVHREPHPGEFAKLLKKAAGTKEELLISRVMLRSLMKARYSPDCEGHFGLAFKYYCHFTSPIRRYADLAIHRIIKEYLSCGITDKRYLYLKKFADSAAKQASETEIVAMEAEREADDIKKAEYMRSHIGEDYTAIISSVTNFGIFAELENGIEGLIRLADLKDDYYIYDETNLTLIGERSGMRYSIGDSVQITVAAANTQTGQIDFCMA